MNPLSLSKAKMKLNRLEFEGWKETIAIRSDAAFMEEIKKGLAAFKKGKTKIYTLKELFK